MKYKSLKMLLLTSHFIFWQNQSKTPYSSTFD